MDVKQKLRKRFDKAELMRLVDYFISNPKKIAELMECFFTQEGKIDQYAAWIVPYIAQRRPDLIAPFFEAMIDNLDNDIHTGVIRNTMRTFEDVDIPEDLEGRIFDKCIDYITDTKLPVAVPAFSISVATKICEKYPDLGKELLEIIRPLHDVGGPAIRVRVRRAVKALS